MTTPEYSLLRGILSTVARQTFSPESLLAIVVPNSAAKANAVAFNLCDGSRTQSEVAVEAGLDRANFSKRLQKWVDAGVIIRVPNGKSLVPLHIYPIPEAMVTATSGATGK